MCYMTLTPAGRRALPDKVGLQLRHGDAFRLGNQTLQPYGLSDLVSAVCAATW